MDWRNGENMAGSPELKMKYFGALVPWTIAPILRATPGAWGRLCSKLERAPSRTKYYCRDALLKSSIESDGALQKAWGEADPIPYRFLPNLFADHA
jgi:hypothetical protein